MATLAAVTNMPALALLSEDGELERSTEPFRRWFDGKADLCLESPELRRVLEGQANAAVLKIDGIAVDIAAMTDRSGARHVLLTLPTEELPSLGDVGGALLDGALDESPALVWLKDLDGRYVRVNSRFTAFLDTSEERLVGRTDAEVSPAETVDGPRLQERGDDAPEEPLHLEYFVGPFQGREGLVVLRFPVGDRHGVPTLVCGVAAPSSASQVARSEAARLLRIERWSRLDAESVLAELLAEWDLLPDARGRTVAAVATSSEAAPSSGPIDREHQAAVAEARAERATAIAERDSALSANDRLTHELDAAQGRLTELERALAQASTEIGPSDAEVTLAAQAAELERRLTRERERAEELERTLTSVRERLGDDAEAARVEVQRARADAEAARTEVERARADADAARVDVDKARADAEVLRAAVAGEREAAAQATAALERQIKQARDELAALERQQGADDSGAQLRAAEKARLAAEAALADAVGERDGALKARASLAGELEQERSQVVTLRESSAAAEELIRELTGGLERERVRVEGLERAQAQARELEAELRAAGMRADKAEVELEVARGRADKAESELLEAVARADQARGDDSGAQVLAAEKARAAAEAAIGDAIAERDAALKARVVLESELEQERRQVVALRESSAAADERIRDLAAGMERERVRAEGLDQAQGRVHELEDELRAASRRADKAEIEVEQWQARLRQAESQAETQAERGQARIEELDAEVKAARDRIQEVERQLEVSQGRIGALEAEVKVGRAMVDELEAQLAASRSRIEELEAELERIPELSAQLAAGTGRIEELGGEIELAQARVAELEGELEERRARVDELESELESARAVEVLSIDVRPDEPSLASDEAAVLPQPSAALPDMPAPQSAPEPSAEPPEATELATLEAVDRVTSAAAGGVSWHPTAKRTLSASLARESVWRNVLKETVQVLGSEGGWDTVTAWLPDDANALGCAAIWTAHRGLDRFESQTLDVPIKRDGSLLDQALQAPHLTWLTDLDTVDDERLQTAAAHGMSSALLLPVRTGNTTIGLLELLTHDTIEPDAQIALSLEASALQLGRFGHLLSLGK